MPVSTLDPVTALIVIDLQKGIASLPTAHPFADVISKSVEVLTAFRDRRLPVVLVNVTGQAPGRTAPAPKFSFPPDWAELIPELKQQSSDHTITKNTWGAFTNTGLDNLLRSLGVTQVVICGVATSIGVESTARFAHELGYNVTLVTDAMTDMRREAHENSVERIFPRLGETTTATELVTALAGRATG